MTGYGPQSDVQQRMISTIAPDRCGRPALTSLAVVLAMVGTTNPVGGQTGSGCDAPETHALYCSVLIPTPAAQGASGLMRLYLAPTPFGVPVTEDGRIIHVIRLELNNLKRLPGRHYVAWVATPDLDERRRLGLIGDDLQLSGVTDWNRFLVVVTAEAAAEVRSWTGPVLLSASSPSGWLTTMAGEEIFGNNELPVQSQYCLVNKC